MTTLIYIILWIIFIYLAVNTLYVFAFALAGVFGKNFTYPDAAEKKKFIVLIAAYKGDEVILSTARESFNQNYPREFYDILVIADRLKPETVAELKTTGVDVLEVFFESSTKSKALNAALNYLPENVYDYAVVLDIDNVMHPDFLYRINNSVSDNKLIVQGHRAAKNLDSDFAILDAVSEEINNTIFRKGHQVLGLSSALIGSGKAMQFNDFKILMSQIHAIGGFDKEMEVRLLAAKKHIYYVEDAIVYDEKVQLPEVFENQRKRWISAQIFYLKKYFFDALKKLFTQGNVDYFDKVLQFILLPRVLLIASTLLFAGLSCILCCWFPVAPAWWLLPILVLFSLVLATPSALRNSRSLLALRSIPKAAFILFITLFRLKGANKKFIHTPHSSR